MNELLGDPAVLLAIVGFLGIAVGLVAAIVAYAQKSVFVFVPAAAALVLGMLFVAAPDLVIDVLSTPSFGKLGDLGG